MANNDMTLAGANQAQTQYVNYYNQIQKQLGANAPTIVAPSVQAPQQIQYQAVAAPAQLNANLVQDPGQLQAAQIGQLGPLQYQQIAPQAALNAYTIQSPGQLTAQLVSAPVSENLKAPDLAAPERINAERINVDQYSQQELANQIAAYLRPYTENAIRQRQQQTVANRAAIDVDAASRGMGASTWVTDAKNRQVKAEAADIANLENTYLGNLNQSVFSADQAQRERAYNAALQNAANQLNADINYAKLLQDYNTTKADLDWQATRLNAQYAYDAAVQNANAQMAADQFNLQNAMAVNQYNAQARAEADRYNAEREWNRLTTNANLAQEAANRMYDTEYNRLAQNAQLAQNAALASYNAQNDVAARNAAYLNEFAMYNNDNAYNAAIAERAYRDALAQQGLEWAYDADKWNGQMAYNAAVQNADLWATLQQLAWQRAAQLGELADVGGGGSGGGDGDVTVTGDETPASTGTGTFWSDLLSGAKEAAAAYDAAQLAKARAATPAAGSGGGGMVYDPSMMVSNSYAWSGYQDNRQPTTTPQDIISRTTGMYYDPSIADKNKRTTPTAKYDSNDKPKAGGGKPTQNKKN
jgi:hypothetical protein